MSRQMPLQSVQPMQLGLGVAGILAVWVCMGPVSLEKIKVTGGDAGQFHWPVWRAL
ncbi:hypothetical protein [Roseobacter sp. MH60115]|uniref:hypothetical protein n=1 Tax=Roseobacter sp. MH60115 TaxID=2785324 RepID=UPI0018A2FA2B|nr:hypothetical protein [Roseobacter sp. MH60115]